MYSFLQQNGVVACRIPSDGTGYITSRDVWAWQLDRRRVWNAAGVANQASQKADRAPSGLNSSMATRGDGARRLPTSDRPLPADSHSQACAQQPRPTPAGASASTQPVSQPSTPPATRARTSLLHPRTSSSTLPSRSRPGPPLSAVAHTPNTPVATPMTAPPHPHRAHLSPERPLDARELMAELAATGSCRQLLQLLHIHEPRLDGRHLDLACSRMARLLQQQPAPARPVGQLQASTGLGSLSSAVGQEAASEAEGSRGAAAADAIDGSTGAAGRGGGFAASTAAEAVAAVAGLHELLRRVLPPLTPRLRPRDCSSILASLVRLHQPPPPLPPPPPSAAAPLPAASARPGSPQRFLPQWRQRQQQQPAQPSPRRHPSERPQSGMGVGGGGGGVDAGAVRDVSEQHQQQPHQLQHQQVAGPRPPAAVVALLVRRFLQQLQLASVRDRAQLLHAVAKLKLREGAAATDGAGSHSGQAAAQGEAGVLPRGAVAALVRGLDVALAAEGKAQDVSMALWAVATLCGPGPDLQGGQAAAAAAGLGDQDAAAAACATGGGGGTSTGGPSGPLLLPPGWLRRVTEQALTRQRLEEYSAQALSNTAWALARLGAAPPPGLRGGGWLGAVAEASQPLLPVFHTQELCNLLWAMAVCRHRPPARWLVAALGLLAERAEGLEPQDVSNVCWSLAALRVRPGVPLLQRLVARALAVRRRMKPQEVISTLWGLSRLRVQLPERAVALLLRGGMGAAVLAPPAAAAASTAAAAAAARQGGDSDDVGSTAGAAWAARARPGRPGHWHGAAAAGAAAGGPVAGPGDLAGAALVLARCRVVPDGRWMSRFYAAVARELPRFGPRELVTLLYSLGALSRSAGLRPEPRWLDTLLARAERLAGAAPPGSSSSGGGAAAGQGMGGGGWGAKQHLLPPPAPPPPLAALLELGVQPEPEPGPQAATASGRVSSGDGRQQAAPPHLYTDPASSAQAARVFSGAGSSNNSSSVAAAGSSSEGSSAGAGGPRQAPGGQALDAAQLTIVLWAVARMSHAPPEVWVVSMARAVAAAAHAFGPQEAATALRALQELVALAEGRSPPPPPVPKKARRASPAVAPAAAGARGSDGGDGSARRGGAGARRRQRVLSRQDSPDGGDIAILAVQISAEQSLDNSGSGSSSSSSSSTDGLSAREVVAGLAARLALLGRLPQRDLYGTLRAASLALSHPRPPPYGTSSGEGGYGYGCSEATAVRVRQQGAHRAMSYASYATVADQLLLEAYSVSSLGLLLGR